MYSAAPKGARACSSRKAVNVVLGGRPVACTWKTSKPRTSVVSRTVTSTRAFGIHAASCAEDGVRFSATTSGLAARAFPVATPIATATATKNLCLDIMCLPSSLGARPAPMGARPVGWAGRLAPAGADGQEKQSAGGVSASGWIRVAGVTVPIEAEAEVAAWHGVREPEHAGHERLFPRSGRGQPHFSHATGENPEAAVRSCVEGVPTLRTVSEWQSGALNAIRYRPRIDAARPATVVPEAVGRQGRRWASASRRGAVVWAVPFRLLWTGRRQFTGGASLLHRERAGGQRGSSPIIRIHDGDGLCPKILGVEYGAHDGPEAERAVSRNGPPRVQAPIHYPRRYLVLDVDVDDHARREARARDGVRGGVRDRARGGRAFVGGSGPRSSRQGRAGGQ